MGSLFSKKQHLIHIINSVEDVELNQAKYVWILRIFFYCNCDECIIFIPLNKTFGAEYEFFLGPIQRLVIVSFLGR